MTSDHFKAHFLVVVMDYGRATDKRVHSQALDGVRVTGREALDALVWVVVAPSPEAELACSVELVLSTGIGDEGSIGNGIR